MANDLGTRSTRTPAAEIFAELNRVDRPESTPALFGTACVLGGSIGGLLAARVLADHARTVLVVERDDTGAG
jgi:NADPH-dependent 2,4-dienoyl-CoA reductase/sulfur reductase-like enzyme